MKPTFTDKQLEMFCKDSPLISLAELSRLFTANKSNIAYYASKKLIIPEMVVGKMFLFSKVKTIKRLLKIWKLQDKGFTLQQIKTKLGK